MSRTQQKNTRSAQKTIEINSIGLGRLGSETKLLVLLIIGVCTVVLAVYWPALSAQALSFDDYDYLTSNMLVQNPGWASAWRFLSEVLKPSTVEGYYQPLAMISLMFDYALGGRENDLMPFHRTSLALHIANTALIIVLLYLLFGQTCGEQTCLERSRDRRTIWIAAGVGMLFGVHPMTVEPIPWVGERKTLLAAFFALWSLVLYVRYTQKGARKFYFGSFAMYFLALMSKPTSVPLPAVMLLLDYWPLRRFSRHAIAEKLPFFVIGIVSAVITYVSQTLSGFTSMPTKLGLRHATLVLCHNIIFYLYKIIWPVNLSSHYAFPKPMGLSDPMVLAGVIGTCILIPLLVLSLRWMRAALTGFSVFFVAIFPTMGVIGFTVVIAADKFAYLPSIGLLMVLASFLGWFCSTAASAGRRLAVAVIVLALTGAEAAATRQYLAHWRDSMSLGEYMLSLTPNSGQVHNSLASTLQSQGRLDEAISHYRRALQARPYDALVYNNLGAALEAKGNLSEAIACYYKALKLLPDCDEAYYNLGIALHSQGDSNQAIYNLRKAISINPDYADAHNNLGIILSKQGRLDEAITHFQKAVRLKSGNASMHGNLGDAFQLLRRLNEAADQYREALRLKPDDIDVCFKLGGILESQGKIDEAISLYRQILPFKTNSAELHCKLGIALSQRGETDKAISHYREAIRLKPDYAQAHINLGITLSEQGKTDQGISHFRQVLQFEPNSAEAHNNLGIALGMKGNLSEAVTHYRQAMNLKPDWPLPLNGLAWILATNPDPNMRDAKQAVELAERAAAMTRHQDAIILNTLAAAYAAAGKFDKAAATAQQALELARTSRNDRLIKQILEQLEHYRQAKP